MDLYRVTWVDPAWPDRDPAEPFHPLHVAVDRQGAGRFDNPHRYAALYASTTPEGAVGETLGNSATWIRAEVERPKDGRPRCLVHATIPDGTAVLDLDDPRTLIDLALRPSDVVRRDRERTQEVALSVWSQRRQTGILGFRWWSRWRPEWVVVVLWSDGLEPPWFPSATVAGVTELTVDHPAVVGAADALPRELLG